MTTDRQREHTLGAARLGSGRPRAQRGSFAVMGAVWLLIAIIVLGSIDIGHFFVMRRDLQRIADLSAMAAVQTMDNQCSSAPTTALTIATANDSNSVSLAGSASSPTAPTAAAPAPASSGTDMLYIQCGRWDASSAASSPAYGSPAAGFSASNTPFNAAWVQVVRSVPYFFFGTQRTISAFSTARASPADSFSVSTQVASLNSTWLNALLSALLGQPSGINFGVGGPAALANANITLGNLAKVVTGVGTVNSLVTAAPISLSTFLADLSASNIGLLQAGNGTSAGDLLNLQAGAAVVSTIAAQVGTTVGNATVNIANPNYPKPLINLGLATPSAGAATTVNLLDLVTSAAEVANGQNAVKLGTSLSLPLAPGVNATAANIQLQVLNPAQTASGEAGLINGGTAWRTAASTASIALYMDLSIPNSSSLPGVGSLLSALGVSIGTVDLPLYLLVAPGTAGLAAVNCNTPSSGYGRTTIVAQPGVARLCLGTPLPTSGTSLNLANANSCPATSGALKLLSLTALGISADVSANVTNPLLAVPANGASGSAYVSAPYSGPVPSSVATPTLSSTPYHFCDAAASMTSLQSGACGANWVDPSYNNSQNASTYWTAYSNNLASQLGTAIGNLGLQGVTINLVIPLTIPVSSLTPILSAILSPVLAALDSVLMPLLSVLGVQVGAATVHQISLTCNAPQIVN